MTNLNPVTIIDNDEDMGGTPHRSTRTSDAGAASSPVLKMTSQNPIIIDDEVLEGTPHLSNHTLNFGVIGSQSSKTTHNVSPLTVDKEAIERPPYTGIQQWIAMKRAAARGPAPTTPSNGAANPPPTSSDPQGPSSSSSSSPDCRRRTASAYHHLPVPPDQPQPSAPARALWHIPPQPVCKGAEQPTPVCGKWSRALREPPKKPRRKDTGPYRCPRCTYGYARVPSVRLHFPRCVALNGNPDCDSWTDDDSCVARQRGPIRLVPLGVSELIIRTAMHPEWMFFPLQLPTGVEPPVATKEEEEGAWEKILNDLKEETRNGQETFAEMEALIQLFKEEGQWDSGSEDEA